MTGLEVRVYPLRLGLGAEPPPPLGEATDCRVPTSRRDEALVVSRWRFCLSPLWGEWLHRVGEGEGGGVTGLRCGSTPSVSALGPSHLPHWGRRQKRTSRRLEEARILPGSSAAPKLRGLEAGS